MVLSSMGAIGVSLHSLPRGPMPNRSRAVLSRRHLLGRRLSAHSSGALIGKPRLPISLLPIAASPLPDLIAADTQTPGADDAGNAACWRPKQGCSQARTNPWRFFSASRASRKLQSRPAPHAAQGSVCSTASRRCTG